jgi:cytochrome d ubiquinol oxidase subunit I
MALVVAPLQVFIGHLSAAQVYRYQPAKLAAMEAQWETLPAGERADWSLFALPNEREERNEWEVKIPGALGYLLEFKPRLDRPVQGLKAWDPQNRPHMIGLIYYSFRTMVAIGFFMAGLVGATLIHWLRGKLSPEALSQQKWLMWAWVFAGPWATLPSRLAGLSAVLAGSPGLCTGNCAPQKRLPRCPPERCCFPWSA